MKLKNFWSKFKTNKQVQPAQESNIEAHENNIDISISQNENFAKICVADNYTIHDYVTKMQEIDLSGIDNLLNTTIVWNSQKQKVNQGNYYVFRHNGKLYNILVNDEIIKIDERTPVGKETLNKVISFDKNLENYSYFRCIHDENGSSYAVKYYKPTGVPAFELPKKEFLSDFEETMNSLKTFDNINSIIDLNSLQNAVKEQSQEATFSM